MRFYIFTLCCGFLSLLLFVPQTSMAQEEECKSTIKRTIMVSGDAEVRVVPDQVLISMTAETREPDIKEAQAKNDKTILAMMKYATEKLGIKEKNIQTDHINVAPVYKQCNYRDELEGRCSSLDVVYYSVRKGIQIRLDDLDKYDSIISAALSNGITNIDNVQFITTELRKHRDKARKMAAKASQEKAKAIAETLGMKIGKPINVNVNHVSHSYPYSHLGRGRGGNMGGQNMITQVASNGSMAGEGSGLALGQISISAVISATYQMEE